MRPAIQVVCVKAQAMSLGCGVHVVRAVCVLPEEEEGVCVSSTASSSGAKKKQARLTDHDKGVKACLNSREGRKLTQAKNTQKSPMKP